MDTTQTTIIIAVGTIAITCVCGVIRRFLRTRPPVNIPLPPQMPHASQYTPVTQIIQNPLPSAPTYPMYPPQHQYVVYIPPQQQQMPYYPPLTPPPCRGPYQV